MLYQACMCNKSRSEYFTSIVNTSMHWLRHSGLFYLFLFLSINIEKSDGKEKSHKCMFDLMIALLLPKETKPT